MLEVIERVTSMLLKIKYPSNIKPTARLIRTSAAPVENNIFFMINMVLCLGLCSLCSYQEGGGGGFGGPNIFFKSS
jgi:hypothetical protein